MALREKTKRRLKWTVIVAVTLACAAGGGYALRLRQLERRAVAKRAQDVTQLAAGDYYNALHNIGTYVPYTKRNLSKYAK